MRLQVYCVWICVCLGSLLFASTAVTELQSVEVGGSIRIRGRLWHNVYNTTAKAPPVSRYYEAGLPGRLLGPFGTGSRYDFDDKGGDLSVFEQLTRLHVKAAFTEDISAYVELDAYGAWGKNFRSTYTTGADGPGAGGDATIQQSYIEAGNLAGQPLRLRIGRQMIQLGKGWLIGEQSGLLALPMDTIRLTWTPEKWSIDAIAAKLLQNNLEQDGDVDLFGLYATYDGFEPLSVSLYWLMIRDARRVADTNGGLLPEALEDVFGVDQYGNTYLNTLGLRAWGSSHNFDYDVEFAYQFGEADAVGSLFKYAGWPYGDNDAKFDAVGADIDLGYTFDCRWSPRISLGGAYFEGEDNREYNSIAPLGKSRASVSFNRLFSSIAYSSIIDLQQDMSNFWQLRAGVSMKPAENITLGLKAAKYTALQAFDMPLLTFNRNYTLRQPQTVLVPFLTKKADTDIGITTCLSAKYAYSKDLYFTLGWEHLFTGDGLRDGNYLHRNGLEFSGGTGDSNADYFFFDTGLTF